MCRWCHTAHFPSFFHLFCRLSGEVCLLSFLLCISNTNNYRIILATIRYLGSCPCPCCFIKKEHISGLGTKADDQRRGHLCTDNERRQRKVDRSRSYIFENGRSINSTYVDNLLQEESWIPTRVKIILLCLSLTHLLNLIVTERFLDKTIPIWL